MSASYTTVLAACKRAAAMPSLISVASISTMSRLCDKMGSLNSPSNLPSRAPRKDHYTSELREFKGPTVYNPSLKPTRYGFKEKCYQGGPLPRIEEPIKSLPKYKPKDAWSRERALYGQNDYIDLLGDGSIQPYETHKGPTWLIGFRGNEFSRTLRRLQFNGNRIQALRPKFSHELNKRLRFLYRDKNVVRRRGVIPKYV